MVGVLIWLIEEFLFLVCLFRYLEPHSSLIGGLIFFVFELVLRESRKTLIGLRHLLVHLLQLIKLYRWSGLNNQLLSQIGRFLPQFLLSMRPTLSQGVILLIDQLIDLCFFLLPPLCFSIYPLPKCIHTLLHLFHHLHLQLDLRILLRISQCHLASLAPIRVMPCLFVSFGIDFPCRFPSRLAILFKPTHNLRPGQDKPYLFHEVYANRVQCMRHLRKFDVERNEIVEQLLSQVVRVEQLLQFQHLLHLSVTQRGLLASTHPITIIQSLQHRILSPNPSTCLCLIGHTIINFGVFCEEGRLRMLARCPHRRQSKSGEFQGSRGGMQRRARIYPGCPEHAYPRRQGFQGHLPFRYPCGHCCLWNLRFDSLWT